MKLDSLYEKRNNSIMTMRDGSANFIVGLILMFIFQFILTIVMMVTKVSEEFSKTVAYTCIICVINEMAFLITPLSYSKVLGQPYVKNIGFKWKLNPLQVVLCILLAVATICFSSPLANWFVKFIFWTGFDESKISNLRILSGGSLAASLVFVALIPTICEEILFRGMIARSFKSKNAIFAILMSSFLFAIMHGTPIQLVHQFFIGVVCCIAYFMTKSIYAAIIVHFSNNAISLIGSYVLSKHPVENLPDWGYGIMVVVGFFLIIIILWLFYIQLPKEKKEKVGKLASVKDKVEEICRNEEEEKEQMQIELEKQAVIENLDTPEKKEIYLQELKARSQKNGQIDRRALMYAILIGMAFWIIQTVVCYI